MKKEKGILFCLANIAAMLSLWLFSLWIIWTYWTAGLLLKLVSSLLLLFVAGLIEERLLSRWVNRIVELLWPEGDQ
jgi:hypothetical protein